MGLTVLAVPSPARADEVSAAEARVDKLQDLVRRTADQLEAGTRRWEADRASLKRVNLRLLNTRGHIKAAEHNAAAGQARVTAVARRLYMSPAPTGVNLAFSKGPDEIIEALQIRGALNQAAGGDGQIIARAQTARVRLQQEERVAQQLTAEAELLASRSAARLRDLNALAQRTADQLSAAENALQRARGERAARAAKARAARNRATAPRYSFSGGPACTGRSTANQQNGNLDPASLCPLWMAPGERLRYDAAPWFNKMSQYHARTRGGPLCVTDSYRSYSEQVSVYRRKPGLAAVPGRSEHGWGKAVDLCGGVQNFGSSAYNWMKANAGKFGFFHPSWAEPSGSKPEAWHWEFSG